MISFYDIISFHNCAVPQTRSVQLLGLRLLKKASLWNEVMIEIVQNTMVGSQSAKSLTWTFNLLPSTVAFCGPEIGLSYCWQGTLYTRMPCRLRRPHDSSDDVEEVPLTAASVRVPVTWCQSDIISLVWFEIFVSFEAFELALYSWWLLSPLHCQGIWPTISYCSLYACQPNSHFRSCSLVLSASCIIRSASKQPARCT